MKVLLDEQTHMEQLNVFVFATELCREEVANLRDTCSIRL